MSPYRYLGCTHDGAVVLDRRKSHLASHSLPQGILEEALEQIDTEKKEFLIREISFDRVIGLSACVVTTEEDDIIFARRKNRDGLTRFVKQRNPEPCSSVVVILMRADDEGNSYILITAYVGQKGYVEPWDWKAHARSENPLKSYARSVEHWKSKALVYDPKEIVPGSETTDPWHE